MPVLKISYRAADYLSGPWFSNVDVKQVFLKTEARLTGGTIIARTALDPTIVGAGIGYGFWARPSFLKKEPKNFCHWLCRVRSERLSRVAR